MDLKNSTILITGGTSGIGLELLKQLYALGAKIIATGRNREPLERTKKQFAGIHVFQSDVSKPEDIRQLYNEVTKQFPDLNIIINNAGEMRLIDLQETTESLESLTHEVDVNLSGTIHMVHQFLPHLAKQKSAAIINVSSAIAFMPYSIAPVYSASKAAVRAYTMALRLQLKDTSVKVFEIIPPGVNTNLQNNWVIKPNPSMMMEADKLVKIVIEGLRRNSPELKPLPVGLIKFMSRLLPEMLMNFGHREFKKFRQLSHI